MHTKKAKKFNVLYSMIFFCHYLFGYNNEKKMLGSSENNPFKALEKCLFLSVLVASSGAKC